MKLGEEFLDEDSDSWCPDGNMTGYDLADFLRQWLIENEHADKSVCEVIQSDDRFSHIRCHVGTAKVFWSHLQLERFLGGGFGSSANPRHHSTASLIALAIKSDNFFSQDDPIWLDYFCLRQCQNDFVPEVVVELIAWIGKMVASLDDSIQFAGKNFMAEYLSRSFCVLELFAAVKGRVALQCRTNSCREAVMPRLMSSKPTESKFYARGWCGPVNVASAKTRDAKDKELIDSFIIEHIGFEEFDRIITAAVIDADGIQGGMHSSIHHEVEQRARAEMEKYLGRTIPLKYRFNFGSATN